MLSDSMYFLIHSCHKKFLKSPKLDPFNLFHLHGMYAIRIAIKGTIIFLKIIQTPPPQANISVSRVRSTTAMPPTVQIPAALVSCCVNGVEGF